MLTTRRQALKTLTAAAVASTALGRISSFAQTAPTPTTAPAPKPPTGPFTLPPLPYAYEALEPYIDTETMHLHHDKHHAAYVNNLNKSIAVINADRTMASLPAITSFADLENMLKNPSQTGGPTETLTIALHNGGGHYNHSLFWQTLAAKGSDPNGALAKALDAELGGLEKVKAEMTKTGASVFGSGWSWLVLDGSKKLKIISLPNQDSPLMEGHYPLFGIDVWEHAYYLKYHNVRADYLANIWNIVNWDFISKRYEAAMA